MFKMLFAEATPGGRQKLRSVRQKIAGPWRLVKTLPKKASPGIVNNIGLS
jgi:hypothetical protein